MMQINNGQAQNETVQKKTMRTTAEKTYGYIRVSSREQNDDRQRAAMAEFGVPADCIFADKQSGKDFERPGYRKLMKKLKPEDTLVIKSIDRLGRNYEELQRQKQEEYSSEESQWNSRRNLQNCVNCG